MAKSFKSTRNLTGGDYKQKLYFVPDADNEPKVGHEISEPAIFRFLLNEETHPEKFDEADEVEIVKMLEILKDIDKHSKITLVEAYQSSMMKATDTVKAYHVFIVFNSISETADDGVYCYWWSLEKSTDYIFLQRSRNKENVKDKCKGEERTRVKLIEKDLEGKGTIKDLFGILWAQQLIAEKYHIKKSNCQSLVTFVGQQITEIGYKYKGKFKYYPPPEKYRNKKMLDLINVITGCSDDWSPLFHLIKMGSTDLVDKTVASGKYDINASCKQITPLHLAIRLKKTKMVKHLLQHPLNADPTKRDASGKSALLFACSVANGFEMKEEIIDLLLKHDKVNVDDVDENGRTALHWAAGRFNVSVFQKLIEKRANPNIYDKQGQSPLHLATLHGREAEIIDLLLAHDKVKLDDVNAYGQTALHWAALASNVIPVQKLLEKEANSNIFDKWGQSPLHVAAAQRNGNEIIDILLEAQIVKGLGDVNDQNKEGRTALHYAAAYSNEITAEHLINKGANVNCRTNVGLTPLHYAALGAKDMKIIDLLLQNINEGDIQQYKNDERLFFFAGHNKHGLGNKILDRLVEKGIQPPCTGTDHCTGESDDEATDVNTRRFVLDKGADPSIDLTGFDGLDFLITRVKISLGIYDDINGRDQKGETLLLIAIRENNVNAVRNLLENGADPTIRNNKGETPFHVAVENCKDFDILNLLLKSGKVDINETNKYGMTALHMAIRQCNTATAEFLLSKGANPNVTDKDGYTPLHFAAWHAKDMDIVELLLNHKNVDVNLMDDYGRNALIYAKWNKDGLGDKIANQLKEKGAVEREDKLPKRNFDSLETLLKYTSRNAEDEIENFLSDATVPVEDQIARINEEHLVSAIGVSDVESVRRLLKNGADISNARGRDGMNALHVASKYAKTTDLIDVILETGKFDINGVDNDRNTPLHHAISGINLDIKTRHLIEKGADPNIADKYGDTPLHKAASHAAEIETISLILENEQVDINSRGRNGQTALHRAIRFSKVITVRYLLKKGADPNAADENGATPLHLAAKTEDYWEPTRSTPTELIDIILETGKCNINGVDNYGRTPLHYAIGRYYSPVTINARHLIQLGADPGIADKNGVTPLHVAAMYADSMDLIDELLLKVKTEAVDVNCVDNQGRTPLACARDNKHGLGESIIARLKEYGAK